MVNVETEVASDSLRLQFRDVIGRFATGVAVITAHDDGAEFGAAASAVASLSDTPPMVLVCLNTESSTARAIRRSGGFAINVLAEGSSALARHFATKSADKFASLTFQRGYGDAPLVGGSIAHVQCAVDEIARGGTHLVFLARVVAADSMPGDPLAYYRGGFGRMIMDGTPTVPRNAQAESRIAS